MQLVDWNIEAMTGYVPKTTFYLDFSIADNFGMDAVKDTYERAFDEWKDNIEYVTELIMVLNWKIWEHYERNGAMAKLYNDLWIEADRWAMENLSGEDLNYYIRTTD